MAPRVGEHTEEILRGLGYTQPEIADLLGSSAAMVGGAEAAKA